MLLPGLDSNDPYGSEAKALLSPVGPALADLTSQIADTFYNALARAEETARVLDWLRPEEFERLKQRQASHIATLLSPDLTAEAHAIEARRAGRAHALTGVQVSWLTEAYSLYQEEIRRSLAARIEDPAAREAFMRIVSQRILLDLEGQVASYQAVNAEITHAFSELDRHVTSTSNLTDLVRGALDIIGGLSGDVSVFFARVDDGGQLQIEQSFGLAAEQYHRAMEEGVVPKISVDPNLAAGRGPGGRAWRSGEITASDAWLIEPDKAPWQSVGKRLGFRASCAVPLLDESGRSIAMLSLYSAWPGYFSTDRVRGFFSHVQRVLSHAIQQVMSAPVIPLREQQAYRSMLAEQCVVLRYQPIIDLSDGRLVKVEALARLCTSDGELISPQRFLPALGRDELLALFELGLKQACNDCQKLSEQQIDTKIALNFPAEGFDDPRYEETLFRVMEDCGLSTERLQLEVLETQDSGQITDVRQAFIQRLRQAGIEIAEDDLGSGHSSLLRLHQYSFDEVKIDQALVRGALQHPKRAVEFILYLTRLAHAFNVSVTVEGLENIGLIEAAAILGADRGQGYCIAKPMPAQELPDWHRNYRYTVNPAKPKTAIGAMAGYLLWDMQLAAISERPELVSEFVGAKSLIDEFIEANNLHGSSIHELVRRNHELAASPTTEKEAALIVRNQLIKELTDHWLAEAN